MSENTGLDQPFYVGAPGVVAPPPPPPGSGTGTGGTSGASTAVSLLVPGSYPVALAGHPYLLDLATSPISHQPIPLLKQQFDSSALPGEQSLSHDILWRRPQESWRHGAGQTYLDKSDSDPERFRVSKGIDVWTRGQFELLPDVDRRYASTFHSNFTLKGIAANAFYYYLLDGTNLKWTTSLFLPGAASFTTVTVANPNALDHISDIAVDGVNVYLAYGTNGVIQSAYGSSASTVYSAVADARYIGYVRGRLLVSGTSGSVWSLYNLTASGAPPTPLIESSTRVWQFFAEAGSHIYIGANYPSGFRGFIYKTEVKPDGTALDVPSVALELPDGEYVTALQGYLGFLIIGTSLGVRLAQVGADGNLTIGGLIRTPFEVRALEPQGKFVWFGWSNYDIESAGLGRMDLSEFTAPLVPAYASDLMVDGTGTGHGTGIVTSISTMIFDTLTFTLEASAADKSGVYTSSRDRKTPTGYLDSGLITFGLPDPKVAFYVDVRYKSLAGTHKAYIATSDGGTFTLLGTHTATSGTGQFSVGQLKSDVFEIREELYRDATLTNTGPIITRHTLKAEPAADTGIWITAPLLLSSMDHVNGSGAARDPLAELDFIQRLRADQTLVFWQEGNSVYQVVVDDYQWQGMKWSDRTRNFEGTCVTKMKVVV